MKKIKLLVYGIAFIVLVIGVCVFSFNKKDLCLLLGNNDGVKIYLKEYLKEDIDDSFNFKSMKSKELLYYLKNDALIERKSIISLIKEAKYVIINIGLNDLLSKVTISKEERKVIFDEDNIDMMFEVLKSNLKEIKEIINLANNNCSLYFQGYDNIFYFEQNNILIERLNTLLKNIDSTFYIDCMLENLNYYDGNYDVYLNDYGKQKIAEKISQKIIANN